MTEADAAPSSQPQAARRRPTSRDVARLAGVSQTTVSFVLNNVETSSVSAETRARVLAAIAQLGYHPHQAARILGRQATRDIAVVIPDATNLHYLDVVAGVEAYAEGQQYGVVVAATRYDMQRERHSLLWLAQRRVDALILCSGGGNTDWHAEACALVEQGYVMTSVGLHIRGADVDTVEAMIGLGERRALEHLTGLGHRCIGYIYGVFNMETYGGRLAACLAVHRELGLPIVERWVRHCGPTLHDGYQATQALLAACSAGDRPTALIVINDHLAIGVLAALARAGLAVPAEISVVSFDNTVLAAYSTPALTTVDPRAHAMGEHAARLTIERLANPGRPPQRVHTQPQLVIRDSTGPAPMAGKEVVCGGNCLASPAVQ